MPRRNWPSAERSLPLELMRALVGDALEGKYGKREERQFDSAFDLSVKEAMGARGERGLVGKLVPVIGFVSDVRNHVITLCLIEKYWHAPEDGMDAYVQVHVSRSRARDGESHGTPASFVGASQARIDASVPRAHWAASRTSRSNG